MLLVAKHPCTHYPRTAPHSYSSTQVGKGGDESVGGSHKTRKPIRDRRTHEPTPSTPTFHPPHIAQCIKNITEQERDLFARFKAHLSVVCISHAICRFP